MAGVEDLIGQYNSAFNAAKTANVSRYNDILGGYQQRYNTAMSGLQGMGQTAAGDINRQYDRMQASQTQGLIGRGLGNTTVANSVYRGVESDRSRQLGALDEQLRTQKLGMQNQLSGDTLGFMERRTDAYPDANLLASLSSQYGARDAANRALAAAGYGSAGGPRGNGNGKPDIRPSYGSSTPSNPFPTFGKPPSRPGGGSPYSWEAGADDGSGGVSLPGSGWMGDIPGAVNTAAGAYGNYGYGAGAGMYGSGPTSVMPGIPQTPGASSKADQWGGQTGSSLYGNPDYHYVNGAWMYNPGGSSDTSAGGDWGEGE